MFRASLGIVALLAVSLAAARSPAITRANLLGIGDLAPPFAVDTLDGRSIDGNFHGRPAYINVFATWCSPCRREFPAILRQAEQYRDRIDFLLVDDQEPASRVKSFANQLGAAAPIAVDRGQFAATFDVQGLPESIFIDRRGIVRYIYQGTIPDGVLAGELSALASDPQTSLAAR
ncbi:MAG: TlpA family protein disulfide reductase [Candidatus Eremiobacteraeota bacterium]|nr:TlpA family protein disulfide reductase [Candidatus Eremiobacteraeota bacterium]